MLEALQLPADSQLLLFSKASLQGRLVSPANPRALFFNDRVALGWVRDGDLLEVAAHDARAGMVFYTLEQRPAERPRVQARVPVPRLPHDRRHAGRARAADVQLDARRRGERHAKAVQRWISAARSPSDSAAGSSPAQRRGDAISATGCRRSTAVRAATWRRSRACSTPTASARATSDIAALLTFSHQTHMINLLTRASWEARAADPALHPGGAATQDRRRAWTR